MTVVISICMDDLAIFSCFDARTKTSDMMTHTFHKAGMAWYLKKYHWTSWVHGPWCYGDMNRRLGYCRSFESAPGRSSSKEAGATASGCRVVPKY